MFRREEAKQRAVMTQIVAGRAGPRRKRRYEEIDKRITTVVEDYPNRDYVQFLRGIAHNFELNV